MIHIVFQEKDAENLKKSFLPDQSLAGDIIVIKDDYAVGPLLPAGEDVDERKQWWQMVLLGGDYEGLVEKEVVNDEAAVSRIKELLAQNDNESVWIWMAPNIHDVCGYFWIITQLEEFLGRIFTLYLHNLPFINEKGAIFYPNYLFEIPPGEFLKAKKLAHLVSGAEFETDKDEWKKFTNGVSAVRSLEGAKKIIAHGDDRYDKLLIKFITPDWQKASKIIHQFLHKSTETTGDAYLLWRIKTLVEQGLVDAQGELKGMKDFEVKIK